MLDRDYNGNFISTFPPCYAFQMIFTAFSPRQIQSISRNVHNKNGALKRLCCVCLVWFSRVCLVSLKLTISPLNLETAVGSISRNVCGSVCLSLPPSPSCTLVAQIADDIDLKDGLPSNRACALRNPVVQIKLHFAATKWVTVHFLNKLRHTLTLGNIVMC